MKNPRALERLLPRLVLAPGFALGFAFIYGLMIWNALLSFTASRMLPNYEWVGLAQYEKLFAMERWWVAAQNLGVFAVGYVGGAMLLGLLLAVLLDQKIRAEGTLRTIYLYPMALSFVVTGTAWKWLLNPDLGLARVLHTMGFADAQILWLVQPDTAIYCVVLAGVWQSAGFCMALFLAGLRGIDASLFEAAKMDGAGTARFYFSIALPLLRPVFFSTLLVLSHLAIKSFDLVMALTGGGPGFASDVPATFMYTMAFSRGQIGLGAASATVMLMTVAALVVPYLYSELRSSKASA